MASFIIDDSVEAAVSFLLASRGQTVNSLNGDSKAIVGLAQADGGIIVTRRTDYPALLEALGAACPCLIWVGQLPGHPMIAEQLDLFLGPDLEHLSAGNCIMMMPGRNEILKIG